MGGDVTAGASLRASDGPFEADQIFTNGYVNHQEPDVEGGTSDRPLHGYKALLEDYHRSFSHSRLNISSQIAEGDLVATHWELTATHTGYYLGHADRKGDLLEGCPDRSIRERQDRRELGRLGQVRLLR